MTIGEKQTVAELLSKSLISLFKFLFILNKTEFIYLANHVDSIEACLTGRLDSLDRLSASLVESDDNMDWSTDDASTDEEYDSVSYYLKKNLLS